MQLYWVVRNLLQCLNSLRYTSYHVPFVHFLRDALKEFGSAQSDFLQLVCTDQPALVTQERLDASKKRLDAAMEQVWASFGEARRRLYVAKSPMDVGEQTKREQQPLYQADPYTSPKGDQHASEQLTFLIRRESEDMRTARAHSYHSPALSASTHDVFLRSSFVFYLARFHVALCKVKLKSDVIAPLPHCVSSPTLLSPSTVRSARRHRLVRTEVIRALHQPWTWSIFGMHPFRDFFAMIRAGWAWLRQPAVDLKWLKSSVKISLIICVASLIAVIPQVSTNSALPNSVWAWSAFIRYRLSHSPV